MRKILLMALLAAALAVHPAGQTKAAPIYVTLWFDTEDYILLQDDDAAKRLAEMLTGMGIRATFKVVGEKARLLESRKRTDVVAALRRHDIGYHSNTHSQQPTVAVYLQNAGWEDGRAEFLRREGQGARDVARIFGKRPVAYGQPGSAWAPQAYPALQELGIGMYLDEADHVGLDDQPFYYGGMLNVFKMRSNLARMDLHAPGNVATGKATFTKAYEGLRTRGGGTISIYYHPNEWVQTEFWDAVNFRGGANPPRAEWKAPGVRSTDETEQAFRDFAVYIQFIKALPGVRFVTASELMTLYADRAIGKRFGRDDLLRIAKSAQPDITFQREQGYALSAADGFGLLTQAMAGFVARHELPADVQIMPLYGPARVYPGPSNRRIATRIRWDSFAQAVLDTADYCRTAHRLPDAVWVGAETISPADYFATLAGAIETLIVTGKPPAEVVVRDGHFTADKFVAADSTDLWSWPIFPAGFHAPHIMELARLQAWTLKPALLHP